MSISQIASKATDPIVHVRPPKLPTHPGFETCEYPILIHSTPNDYCTGALALYASLVRSVMLQPEILKGKVCVHITYVEEKMKTLEEMYRWVPVANPFTHIPACGLLDSMPEWGAIVPVRWQAIPPIELPPVSSTCLCFFGKGLSIFFQEVHESAADGFLVHASCPRSLE